MTYLTVREIKEKFGLPVTEKSLRVLAKRGKYSYKVVDYNYYFCLEEIVAFYTKRYQRNKDLNKKLKDFLDKAYSFVVEENA